MLHNIQALVPPLPWGWCLLMIPNPLCFYRITYSMSVYSGKKCLGTVQTGSIPVDFHLSSESAFIILTANFAKGGD